MITNFKIFEKYGEYNWKNIWKSKDKIYIKLYKLADEMESSANTKSSIDISDMEEQYIKICKNVLINKLITFDTEDGKMTDICIDVHFSSSPYDVSDYNSDNGDYKFEIAYIHIVTEYDNYALDDDLVIIHSDEEKELFKKERKFNV